MYYNVRDRLSLIGSAMSNVAGTLLPGYHASPPAIVWLMTYKCNCACKHCDFWKRDPELDPDKIMLIARKIAESDAAIVNLSGGEVFLVPNIREVIKLLKKSGKYLRINSNGLAIGEHLDFLLEVKADSLAFSIDSVHPDQHDENRGKPGVFNECLKACEYIKSRRAGRKPELYVRSVVMKTNIEQMEDYIRFFSGKADEIGFQPIHNAFDKHKVINSSVLFEPSDEPHVREVIARVASNYDFLDNRYFRSFPDFIFHPERVERMAVDFCLPVLYNTLMIRPDGECQTCTESVGNILKEELPDVWASAARKCFLKGLAAKGHCSTPCWLNSNSARTPVMGGVARALVKVIR